MMPTPTRRAVHRLLDGVHLPITLYMGVAGVIALVDPGLVDRAVAPWLAYTWAASLIVGMVLVVAGVAAERTRLESVGHCLHVLGLLLLAAVSITEIGGGDVIALAALIGVPVLRMRLLRRARAARVEAGRIIRHDRPQGGEGA
jgi:hypothetical protein